MDGIDEDGSGVSSGGFVYDVIKAVGISTSCEAMRRRRGEDSSAI